MEWEPAPEFPLFDPSTSLLVEDSSEHCADLKSRRRWFKTKENALLYSALAFLLNRQQGHFHHPWVRDLLTVNDRWGPRMVLQGEKTEYCGYQVWLLNHRRNERTPGLVVVRYVTGSKGLYLCGPEGKPTSSVLPIVEIPMEKEHWRSSARPPTIQGHEPGPVPSSTCRVLVRFEDGRSEMQNPFDLCKTAYYPLLDYAVQENLLHSQPWKQIFKHRHRDSRSGFYPTPVPTHEGASEMQHRRMEQARNSDYEQLWNYEAKGKLYETLRVKFQATNDSNITRELRTLLTQHTSFQKKHGGSS